MPAEATVDGGFNGKKPFFSALTIISANPFLIVLQDPVRIFCARSAFAFRRHFLLSETPD